MSPYSFQHTAARRRLGWQVKWYGLKDLGFNTQPPEGGWIIPGGCIDTAPPVSTHSRPKAAGDRVIDEHTVTDVSTHSRPKAAGLTAFFPFNFSPVSTHSRPKAAGSTSAINAPVSAFQHTAARRRLGNISQGRASSIRVSTHSRPKAAGTKFLGDVARRRFNTQPPEGGWADNYDVLRLVIEFQHTAARRRLASMVGVSGIEKLFQHTAARRRLVRTALRDLKPEIVSTHSRPKAAGKHDIETLRRMEVSTHSRPKAAGCIIIDDPHKADVSTHSRPKAAGAGDVKTL